jgi:hypothetical protein
MNGLKWTTPDDINSNVVVFENSRSIGATTIGRA